LADLSNLVPPAFTRPSPTHQLDILDNIAVIVLEKSCRLTVVEDFEKRIIVEDVD
jgi:hypothetical protein